MSEDECETSADEFKRMRDESYSSFMNPESLTDFTFKRTGEFKI